MIGIQGANELVDRFNRLAADAQDRISERVLQAGVDYLVTAGQDATPPAKTPGHDNAAIRDSIRGRLLRVSGGLLQAKVGFNVGKYTAPHAHLYVLGTVQRFTKGRRKKVRGRLSGGNPANRGAMPANNFFAQAMSAAEGEAFAVMQQVFYSEMDKQK